MVGLRLPLQSHPLQPRDYEPVLDCVDDVEQGPRLRLAGGQGRARDGRGIDAYNGYAQRGSFHLIEHQLAAAVELFPVFAHAQLLRTWGGIVDAFRMPRRSWGRPGSTGCS